MRGLIIRQPWIDLILTGRKTWEIRGSNTKVRGKIALIRGGSGLIVGTADLFDVGGPFTVAELMTHADKHAVPVEALRKFVDGKYRGKAYAWQLRDVSAFDPPKPYKHPSGAVIWVTLRDVDRSVSKVG